MSASPQSLNPAELPLHGRHLIEASAGTGKTFNITRLYLRLVLERRLSVQNILVMTFTKAATEELRGRIDKELRAALEDWGKPGRDAFFDKLEAPFTDAEQGKRLLQAALLELDEAAIFTIHGFCKRVLSQQAFDSGLPLELSMEADTQELRLQAVRDWLRNLSGDQRQFMLLAEQGWHQPENFFSKFASALCSVSPIISADAESLQTQLSQNLDQLAEGFALRKQQIQQSLLANQALLFEVLIEGKKDAVQRQQEWQVMLSWLESEALGDFPEEVKRFVNGNRYRGKTEIKALLAPVKDCFDQLKAESGKLKERAEQDSQRLPLYQLVSRGILEIRQRIDQAKQRQAVLDFDDLIQRLAQGLQGDNAENLLRQLRASYPVALVDEFQDTDQLQYQILDQLYPLDWPEGLLLMIGDPKQAIYGFRGGDIFTYLAAREQANYRWHMDTNWRSTAEVVEGYNRLFWGAPLEQAAADIFSYGIGYEQIRSTEHAAAAKHPLSDPAPRAALNYLWLEQPEQITGARGKPTKADFQQALATACVAEIQRLLEQATLGEQALQSSDIAVLVRTGSEARLIQEALESAGLSSVYLSSKEPLFQSEEARELYQVLLGIWEQDNQSKQLTALSSRYLAGDASTLARLRDPEHEQEWEQASLKLAELRQLWLSKGVMSLILELVHSCYQPQPERHERALTNTLHLAELLQGSAREQRQPQQLLAWFAEQLHSESLSEEAVQRLESDANLLRIVTQHGSKGLEYPVVFIPFASVHSDPARRGSQYLDYFKYHQPQTHALVEQVGRSEQAMQLLREEAYAESVRLLYVAVTRASHRCYLGVAPFEQSTQSPLGLCLQLSDQENWPRALQQLCQGDFKHSAVLNASELKWQSQSNDEQVADGEIYYSQLQREIDNGWKLSSFSSLIRQAHASLARQDMRDRESEQSPQAEQLAQTQPTELRFSLRKGAAAGNLLHDALEHCDFAQPNWPAVLAGPAQRFGGLDEVELEELQHWLQQCLDTTLPEIGDGNAFSLGQLAYAHTLREAEFYFPITATSMAKLAQQLAKHRGDGEWVALPDQQQLQGMMHGFIDLIVEHEGRFYLLDYKSTHLGNQLDDYHFAALQQNNRAHFYDLQYLIYALALHRYLAQRLPNYQVEQHFGGVYYLYLRGMSPGSEHGIYHCAITMQELDALEKLFSAPQSSSEQLEEQGK